MKFGLIKDKMVKYKTNVFVRDKNRSYDLAEKVAEFLEKKGEWLDGEAFPMPSAYKRADEDFFSGSRRMRLMNHKIRAERRTYNTEETYCPSKAFIASSVARFAISG